MLALLGIACSLLWLAYSDQFKRFPWSMIQFTILHFDLGCFDHLRVGGYTLQTTDYSID